MKRDAIFEAWAPEGAAWSPWVKPVLFAHMDPDIEAPPASARPTSPHWQEILEPSVAMPPVESGAPYRTVTTPHDVALVVDLPGPSGVGAGLELAELGFRPVPAYNAVPGPWASAVDWREGSAHAASSVSLVDVVPIVRALASGASLLRERRPPLDAPPAFLLDANRRTSRWAATSGRFDNRAMCFVTDFPSAELLARAGVRRVVLVQASRSEPEDDLAVVLHAWQKGGLSIQLHRVDLGGLSPCIIAGSWTRWLLQLFRRGSLRPHPLGGFGAIIPEQASG